MNMRLTIFLGLFAIGQAALGSPHSWGFFTSESVMAPTSDAKSGWFDHEISNIGRVAFQANVSFELEDLSGPMADLDPNNRGDLVISNGQKSASQFRNYWADLQVVAPTSIRIFPPGDSDGEPSGLEDSFQPFCEISQMYREGEKVVVAEAGSAYWLNLSAFRYIDRGKEFLYLEGTFSPGAPSFVELKCLAQSEAHTTKTKVVETLQSVFGEMAVIYEVNEITLD